MKMSNGITKTNLMRTAPRVLVKDKNMNPLVDALAYTLEKLGMKLHLPTIYSRIDDLPEDLLDILAKDFKVDWYDFNWSVEAKRATIKDSFYVHRHLGTKGAVLKAVCDVYAASQLQEWYEYDGDPYYFRIIVEASQQLAPISLPGVMNAIELYKSARSHLEGGMPIVSITCSIVIQTDQGGQYYQTRVTGTYPRIATHGNVSDSQIVVETEQANQRYEVPATGEIVAGTHPRISTHGNTDSGGLVIGVETGGMEYYTPRCGDALHKLW